MLSRCQMILTEAKKRAQREFDAVLVQTGHTPDSLRAAAARHPELACATVPIPRDGAAGGAANFALHVAVLDKAAARSAA